MKRTKREKKQYKKAFREAMARELREHKSSFIVFYILRLLVIAVLVQVVELVLRKVSFALYQALGVYLPLITTNCAVLGVTILNVDEGYNLLESVVNGVGGALGFTLAIVLFAGIRERMALSDMPRWMNGFPGALITAGLMAVAFSGFAGLI